jgi:hypothetical protein
MVAALDSSRQRVVRSGYDNSTKCPERNRWGIRKRPVWIGYFGWQRVASNRHLRLELEFYYIGWSNE